MNVVSVVNILNGNITINTKVTVRGWIRSKRDSKLGFSFIMVYDGSCLNPIQVIVDSSLYNYQSEVLRLTIGCSVIVTGVVVLSVGKDQIIEIKANKINIVGWIEDPDTYPMSAKNHSLEYLREMAHLRPRTNLIGTVARIRHTLSYMIHYFFNKNGFFWVSTPLITTSDTEGAGEMFRVSTLNVENLQLNNKGKIDFNKDFFGKESFLTVSGQLNVESYASALSKVYTFGPTFRAENSNTSRHLSEFWMIEPEIAFSSLDDVLILAESMLKYLFKNILNKCIDDIAFLVKHIDKNIINRLQHFIDTDFVQIEYNNAINILMSSNQKFEKKITWGMDLSSEHERYLTDKYFKAPVVVKNYPKDIKAFYMRLNDDNITVSSMDILAPGIGEIIGGSQREERLDVLDKRLKDMNLNKENYWWYRDLRRYGTVPHSGFGLGFERLISYITGLHNVRDVIPFPRTPRNANF